MLPPPTDLRHAHQPNLCLLRTNRPGLRPPQSARPTRQGFGHGRGTHYGGGLSTTPDRRTQDFEGEGGHIALEDCSTCCVIAENLVSSMRYGELPHQANVKWQPNHPFVIGLVSELFRARQPPTALRRNPNALRRTGSSGIPSVPAKTDVTNRCKPRSCRGRLVRGF